MKVGVMGGTFDPIHIVHLLLAETAREQLSLDRVLFMPAGDPWRKAGREITPASLRLEMVRRAIAGNTTFEADDREIRRQGATYTVDTLRELREELGEADELVLLLGDDALADLPHWKEPGELEKLATIAVAPRSGELPKDLPLDENALEQVDMPAMDVSSTDLREKARNGRSLRYLVPDGVIELIESNRLYRT